MAKKSAAGNGGVVSAAPATKPVAKAVSKEAGSAVGADSAVKASVKTSTSNGKGAAAAKAPVEATREITGAMIAEAAYFLHMNGVPGTPEEHWGMAEAQLRSTGSGAM